MGKYSSNSRRKTALPRNTVPPMLRGIGCITFVLVPVLSYGVAVYWIQNGLPGTQFVPPGWFGPPQFPEFMDKVQGLAFLANLLRTQSNLKANLVFALAFTMVIGGFMAIVYGYIYAMFGPSRFGPTDVPPPRVKTKRYKR